MSATGNHPNLPWRASAKCDSGTCVEVAMADDRVYLRQSQVPDEHLIVSRAAWLDFLAAIKRGDVSG